VAPQVPGPGAGPVKPRRRTAWRVGMAAGGILVVLWLLSGGPTLNLFGELLWIAAGLLVIRFAWRLLRRVSWREVGFALIVGALVSDFLDALRRR
jgi:small neutral amino acid transporter SnatA (MarC family)